MKTSTKLLSMFSVFCASLLFGLTANAQSITVAGGLTANQMAQMLVGSNVTVSNAVYTGAASASGSFNQASSTFPLSDGILLTSGSINNALGPNNSTGSSASNGTPGDVLLNSLVPGYTTFDAAILEFDITSNCNTVTFDYIFASEEYLEYACSNFNDAFGFFISGPGFTANTNIALVPGTSTPVSINNVVNSPATNCVSNPAYYVDNAAGTSVQYDGFTVVLTATASIQPCQTYHIKIVVGDAGDSALDSAIFLKGGGINCSSPNLLATANITPLECEALGEIDVTVGSGTGPFTYAWTGPNGFTASTEDITGLAAGDYTVDINGSNCLSSGQFTFTVTETVDVTPPVFATTPSDIVINAPNNACGFSVDVLGQVSVTDDCTIATITSSHDSTYQFGAGTTAVTITATDVAGNASTTTFNVIVNAQPLVVTLTPFQYNGGVNIRCFGQYSGQVAADASGGCCPYTYSWVHPLFGPQTVTDPTCLVTQQVNGLPAGPFSMTVTDAAGTSVTETVTLIENPPIQTVITATPILCYGGTSSVSVTAQAGTAPYAGVNAFNVFPGTYIYLVADANGCRDRDTITITQPDILDITATPTPILCYGETSQVTVAGTGGTLPYTGTGVFTETAGVYTYSVTDANGCTDNTQLAINQPNQLISSISATPILCNGGTSQVTVAVISGNEPYTGTGVFTEYAGEHTYIVHDWNSCPDTVTVLVTEPTPLVATATATAIACNGDSAIVTITAAGGTPMYTGGYTGEGSFTVAAGTHTFTVTDMNGCTDDVTITVSEPTPLVASATATAIACNGGTATVTVTATGGMPMYTGGYTGEGAFTVSAGTHTFTVTDMSGCTSDVTVTVTEPTPLVAAATATAIDCNGGTADVTVSATGGMPMYTGGYTGEGIFTVSAGTYTYTITDMNGCTDDVTITVTEPTPLVAAATATAIDCNGGTADVTVSATGGMPMYTGGYTGEGIFTVSAGTYTYTITDMNGCTDDVTITVTEPTPLVAAATATAIDCNGGTADVTVSATGGMPMYTGGYTGEGTFTVSAGTYTYTITDMNGCTDDVTITVTEPTPLVAAATATAIDCNGGTADVTVSATGGMPMYTGGYTGEGTFTVSAGTYTYTITDMNGCTDDVTITVTEPTPLVAAATATAIDCNGGTADVTVSATGGMPMYTGGYTGEGTFTVSAGTHTFTVTDMNGCTDDVTITVTEPTALVAAATATTIDCNGGTADVTVSATGGMPMYTGGYTGEGTFTVSAGTHTFTVTDMNGCTDDVTITVTEPTALVASAMATAIDCNGGTATVTVSATGGTPTYSGEGTFTVSAGTHTFTVTDANGCTDDVTVTVAEPSTLVASATATTIDCNGGTATVTVSATGGAPTYTGEGTFTVSAGTHTFTVTDANGCTDDVTVTVTEPSTLVASATATTIDCNGGTATVTVSATGGTPTYTGEGTFTVSAGTHTFTVTDANGCASDVTVTVTEPSTLVASATATTIDCNGGTATVTVSATGGTPTYTGEGTFTVSAGTHTFTVTDANGCTDDVTVTVTEPSTLVASATATTIDCNGGTATVTVSATGGAPTYTGEGTFTVSAGTHTFTVTDANGCTDDVTVTVTEPSTLVASATATAIDCNGGSATVTVSATGGTPTYTGEGTFTVSAGTHTFTITDANGCTSDVTVTVTEPSTLVASATATTIDCNGGTATVTVSATGGAPTYTGEGTFTVSAGTHTFTVTDANGCTSDVTVTVVEPTQLAMTATSTGIDCNGGTADVTVSATGGTAPYTGEGTFNVGSGTHTFTVTDANGCTVSQTITVVEPTLMTAYISCPIGIQCNGGTADVAVIAFGGTAPYTGTGVFTVGAGTYTYTVTDANGCTASVSHTITEPAPVVVSIVSSGIDCNGGTADVTVSATGGTAPYTGEGTFTVSAGTYTYTITDANGCTETATITVAEPAPLVASASAASILCNGGSADVTVSATGGTAPYTGTGTFSETAGTYTYTVTDANGCTATTSVTLTQPSLMTAYASCPVITCNGGTADIAIFAFGGTAPYTGVGVFNVGAGTYTYVVTDANGCTASVTHTITEPAPIVVSITSSGIDCNGGTADVTVSATGGTGALTGTGTFNVGPGTYTYTVTDANGCTETATITVTEPAPLVASASAASILCNGGSADVTVSATGGTAPYTGTGTFSETAGTYTYTVTDANGCTATTSVTITEPTLMTAYVSCPGIACNGGTADIAIFAFGGTAPYTGIGVFTVGAGTYTYTVTDANGCTATVNHTVNEPAPIVVSITSSGIDCNGGTADVTVSATGGTGALTGTGTFNVGPGTYTYTVTDANGCTETATITVTEPAPLVASASAASILCNGGSADVTVSATGGTAPYTGTGTFSETAGTYTYTVTDANGCTATTSVTLTQPTLMTAYASCPVIACNGGTADIAVFAFGGTAPYTGTGVFNVGAGTYTYTVTDANGCTASVTHTVTEPAPLVVSITSSGIDCNGGSADVTVSATGGTAPYSGIGTFNVGAGTYTYTVTDENGCTETATITVAEPAALVASASAASILCNGGSADVTVSATGGTAPYTGTGTFSETAGTYTYTVTDANGCTATTSVTLTQPTLMTAYASCPVIACNGGTADIAVFAFGGTAPYTGTGVFNVGAGTYTYVVTDANGCTASVTHTVTEPAAIVATATVSNLDCANETGDVTITATGGTAPYTGTGTFVQSNGTQTYTVTDANGCSTTVTATVEVETFVDLTCPGDQTFACNYSQSCGGQSTGSIVSWDEPTASSFSSCDNGCGPVTAIPGYIFMGEYNGSRYYCSSSSNFSWQAANTAATNAGGHLVTIQSSGENQFVRNAIGASYAWIGFTDENVEGTFEWSNGENVGYTNWGGSEPNNNGPTANNCGYCGEADYTVITKNSGVWYDRFECNLNEFVMEIPCGNPITITQTAGPSNGSFADGGTTQVVTYVATDNVTGATATCSFNVTVEECTPEYCESEAQCTAYEWIKKVNLGSISNQSGNDGGYGDYTSMSTTASAGDVVSLVLKPGFSGTTYTEAWRVWVDWNYDGDFYDQGEMVYQGSGTSTKYGSFTVPQFAATNKPLRVRVSMSWNCYSGPCSMFSYGEVEDYTLYIPGSSAMMTNGGSTANQSTSENNVNMYEDVAVGENGLELTDIYPNPVLSSNGKVNLNVRSGNETNITVRVMDLSGRILLTEGMRLETGANRRIIDVTGFVNGSYIVEVTSGDLKATTQLIVQ